MRLTEELHNLSQHDDGELILRNHTFVWNLHLVRGQLLYATGGFHPVRRWDRAIKQHRPNWNWSVDSSELSNDQFWEYQLLDRGLNQKQLSLIQGKLVIRTIVQECLFELSSCTDLKSDWKPSPKSISALCRVVALSANEMHTVLNTAMQMQQQWQAAGLGHLSPALAPILPQGAAPQALPVLDKYLHGQFTLWDIASQMEKSVTEVTRSLMPWVEKGILQFEKIPDLPVSTVKLEKIPDLPVSTVKLEKIPALPVSTVKQPIAATPTLSETTTTTQPTKSAQKHCLIACIDDSPVLAHTLRKILMPAGYHMLSIPEPMRGFGQLIEHKPDLILLDLLLPNADGYSICKFLRETPVFKKTPIIILTARNTQIDRFRAKEAGATEFLSKPPQAQELLQIIQKYIVP
jgi:chemotaxis family two-component system response regulator PixG